jgi:GntR family transcriptional regulator
VKGWAVQIYISTKDGVPIYLQIVNQVKYMVAAGRLRPGEQLPPVRKLAEELLINPNTVARAYRELEQAKVLSMRQGSGAYVADGASPLARREHTKILKDRIDVLLAEATHMGVPLDEIIDLLRQRGELLR